MFISFSYKLLLLAFFMEFGAGYDQCEDKCGGKGPPIRFPFRLKGRQSELCGYPGFELSCSGRNTVLEFSISTKFFVKSIDYASQVIKVYDPNDCLLGQLIKIHNSSISPFQFEEARLRNYTLFNCSKAERNWGPIFPCLGGPSYQVFFVDSDLATQEVPLVHCKKMYNISSVPYVMYATDAKYLRLNWTTPSCGSCEAKGNRCRFRNNGTSSDIECFKPPASKGDPKKFVALGVTLGAAVLTVVLVLAYRAYSSNKQDKENRRRIEIFLDDYKALKPSRYSYADIKNITSQFKDKLGEGAYGTVFKGKLSSDLFVAVKILKSTKGNGEEFINEVGTMGHIHHVNVVRLAGYCADGFRRALVYEFLPNGSLQEHITSPDTAHFLGWKKLQEISLGIAKGIEYLHQGCEQQILHFDIKPHNVLLDHKFTPKITDFGLAKLCSKDQSIVSMTTARGTMGYIAPEVFSRNFGNVSYKSDVYSFGMLLLELIGGRKITDVTEDKTSQIYYPEWIYNLLEEGEDLRIHIEEEKDANIAKKLAIVGLWCIQWHPADRPSMKNVVQMLEGENLNMPPNPFASTGTTQTTASNTRPRRLNLELESIAE
ncbi:hypothetical protein UlMin_024914 [Ulmus minor]